MSLDRRTLGRAKIRAETFWFARGILLPAQDRLQSRQTAGGPLLAASILALWWANSPWKSFYANLWSLEIAIHAGPLQLSESLRHWVNDALLPLFFFVVGLDIKREVVRGELSSWKNAALPLAAAAGGMLLPAGIYLLLNGQGGPMQGWGIPVATDVAFALGVLSLGGSRVPRELVVLTMAFAAADDVGGVLVIAFFYSQSISLAALITAAVLLVVIWALAHFKVTGDFTPYIALGVAFAVAVYASGVHTTIAGVLLGLMVPASGYYPRHAFFEESRRLIERAESHDEYEDVDTLIGEIGEAARGTEAPLDSLARHLYPAVNYLVLPVFALANAGVGISGPLTGTALTSTVAWGIVGGLVIGKPLGITAGAYLAAKAGVAQLPRELGWRHVAAMGTLAGVGFTVSIFIAGLAFERDRPVEIARLSVIAASAVAALFGYLALRWACSREA